jgi:hypothetical protein
LENWIGAQFVVFICFLTTWEDPVGKYGSGSGKGADARLLRMGDLFKIGGMRNFNRRVIRKIDKARIEVSAAII